MAVPFRRTSKTSKRMRRSHWKLNVTGMTTCPNCGANIKQHTICPECGYYNGKQVLKGKKAKKEEK